MSILFGLTGGETGYAAIGTRSPPRPATSWRCWWRVLFILAGIGYKISLVPFHFWTPDVYEGAPTPVAAIFAAGPKAAGFALLIRFFYTTLVVRRPALVALESMQWPWVLAILSAITMTWGNLAAMRQENVKRLLAYSSIAHVGYLLMGFVLLSQTGPAGDALLPADLRHHEPGRLPRGHRAEQPSAGSENIDDYRGPRLSRAHASASSMSVFLFSLTGLPPTAGFIGSSTCLPP